MCDINAVAGIAKAGQSRFSAFTVPYPAGVVAWHSPIFTHSLSVRSVVSIAGAGNLKWPYRR